MPMGLHGGDVFLILKTCAKKKMDIVTKSLHRFSKGKNTDVVSSIEWMCRYWRYDKDA